MSEPLSVEQFQEVCADQAIQPYDAIFRSMKLDRCFTPPDTLAKPVAWAGHFLSIGAEPLELAKEPLVVTEELAADSAALALTHMIQDSLTPYSDDGMPTIRQRSKYGISACRLVESYFVDTFRFLKDPAYRCSDVDTQVGAEIIVDAEEEPVFIRKASGQPSALSLQPVIVRGVRYPAGSVMRLDLASDELREGENEWVPVVPTNEARRVEWDQVKAARFKRLTAFAFEVEEEASRSSFLNPYLVPKQPADVQKIMREMPLDDIREQARDALARTS